jgi:hypothetical protein
MKKRILMASLFFGASTIAFAQTSAAFEMPLGTFSGKGEIAGGVHTIKLANSLGNFVITYGGATKCSAILSETPDAGVFQETDVWDGATGQVSKKSCKEKGFIYLIQQGSELIYHWGGSKEEALAKPMPVTLKK